MPGIAGLIHYDVGSHGMLLVPSPRDRQTLCRECGSSGQNVFEAVRLIGTQADRTHRLVCQRLGES